MTPREILIAARAKIEAPERWTKGSYARDASGDDVGPSSPDAECWCSRGALGAVTKSELMGNGGATFALGRAIGGYGVMSIPAWNDAPERTHAEVLAAFDRAIELAGDA